MDTTSSRHPPCGLVYAEDLEPKAVGLVDLPRG